MSNLSLVNNPLEYSRLASQTAFKLIEVRLSDYLTTWPLCRNAEPPCITNEVVNKVRKGVRRVGLESTAGPRQSLNGVGGTDTKEMLILQWFRGSYLG